MSTAEPGGARGDEPTREQAPRGAARARAAREESTRVAEPAAPPAPPPRDRGAGRRRVAALALAAACGFLLGVLGVATLGGGNPSTTTLTRRVTVPAPALTTGGTVITKTVVPAVVGETLDVAKQRAGRAKFAVSVDAGGGLFGVLRDQNWEVVAQRPAPDALLEQGSTIHVDIVKR